MRFTELRWDRDDGNRSNFIIRRSTKDVWFVYIVEPGRYELIGRTTESREDFIGIDKLELVALLADFDPMPKEEPTT